MSHVTSIGLDVHARSVAACAFNLYTGEVARCVWSSLPFGNGHGFLSG